MATEQKWGRKEAIIWPPRGFYYTWSAALLALALTGFLVYLRFDFGLGSLQRYYLPYYLRSGMSIRPSAKFQLLYINDGTYSRLALPDDLISGETQQPSGKPLPLGVSETASRTGYRWLYREPEKIYQSNVVHLFLEQSVYGGESVWAMFSMQVYFGIAAFLLQLPFMLPKDIKRRKELRYGRRLKGPYLVTAKQFNAAVMGDGIGIQTEDIPDLLRIPARAENQHILAIGDTGSGKTSVIRQLAFRVQERDECAVIYDPAGEFIRQFYSESRGDIVLNPQDARMPTVADHPVAQWTAKAWSEHRKGWIFLTSTTTTRKAIRPLHCVWLDMLVMHLLSTRRPDQKRVWFLIDELASLQKLPQLHTALTENRKSENPVVLGFQGRSQLETRYGNDAEAMLSQPATKIFFRTDEPRAAKWISDNIGEVEIERLRETHYDGNNKGRNFMLERLREPLVMPSEIQGLVDLSAYLKYGNHVAQFSIPFVKLEDKYPDFIRRKRSDQPGLAVRSTPSDTESPVAVEQTTGDDLGMQVV